MQKIHNKYKYLSKASNITAWLSEFISFQNKACLGYTIQVLLLDISIINLAIMGNLAVNRDRTLVCLNTLSRLLIYSTS